MSPAARSARPRRRGALVSAATAALIVLASCSAPPTETPTAVPRPTAPAPTARTTSPAQPGSGASPASPSRAPRTLSLTTSGDLLWRPALYEAAEEPDGGYDFLPQIESLRPFASAADLSVCHLEGVVQEDGGPFTGFPRFLVPKETVQAISEVGFDLCTTSSNHANDGGFAGLTRTLDTLDDAGLGHAGTWRTEEDSRSPELFTTGDGVVVGVVSQTLGLNGLEPEPGKEWSVRTLDPDRAIEDARRAREAGADVVVFHMHAGDEYTHVPNGDQRFMASRVANSGEVDLIIGQHPHWVQPIDRINGVWVVYSTGNLMTSMEGETPGTHDGAVVQVDFSETADGRFEATGVTWAPTYIVTAWNDPTGAADPRVLLIPDELDAADADLRARLEASAERTREVITERVPEGMTERSAPPPR